MSAYDRRIPEPNFDNVDTGLAERLNQERLRLRAWLSFLLEWGALEGREAEGDKTTRPMLTRAHVIDATETALFFGGFPPLIGGGV